MAEGGGGSIINISSTGSLQPSRRAAVSRVRAAAGVAFAHVVTQMRGEQHRRSAATGAQKADSLRSSTVFLGLSLARRLTVRNLLLRVAACLPVRGVACATRGGSQAACVCRGSSSSTRRRSAAIISSPSFSDSIYWLSLFVCVSAQVMDGTSAVSGHLGDVVLWELNPPAAGEVLIRAGGPPRLLCGSWQLGSHSCAIIYTTRVTF